MKVEKNRIVEIKLILTEDEAKWLKEAMQNPISHNQSENEESIEESRNRKTLWNCLDVALVNDDF